jgi:hypothetical protein
MYPLQILIVYQLGGAVAVDPEVEGSPGDERGFVRQAREVNVRFGMKLRQAASTAIDFTTEYTEDTERVLRQAE